jgi:hypothetical protein
LRSGSGVTPAQSRVGAVIIEWGSFHSAAETANAGEAGVSFLLPGLFGSLAAAPHRVRSRLPSPILPVSPRSHHSAQPCAPSHLLQRGALSFRGERHIPCRRSVPRGPDLYRDKVARLQTPSHVHRSISKGFQSKLIAASSRRLQSRMTRATNTGARMSRPPSKMPRRQAPPTRSPVAPRLAPTRTLGRIRLPPRPAARPAPSRPRSSNCFSVPTASRSRP